MIMIGIQLGQSRTLNCAFSVHFQVGLIHSSLLAGSSEALHPTNSRWEHLQPADDFGSENMANFLQNLILLPSARSKKPHAG